MDAKLLIESLTREGRLQEARRVGEDAIAADPHDSGALEALVNVYLDIETQCINNGVTCYLPDIGHRLDELIAQMTAGDKARRRHERMQLSLLPGYAEINGIEQLSARDGHEREAYDKARALYISGTLSPRFHEIYATILYRWARVAMTDPSSRPVREVLYEYLGVPLPKPSRLHSLMLRLAVRSARKYPDFNFTRFFDLWNPRTLRNDDIVDPDGKYSLAAAAFELVIDSDNAHEFPDLLGHIKAPAQQRMAIVREAFATLVGRHIKGGDTCRAIGLLELYGSHTALHASDVNHSRLLSLALKVMDGEDMWRFVNFFVNWDTTLFRQADFESTPGRDGVPAKPLATRAQNRCFAALKADTARHEHMLAAVLRSFDNIAAQSPTHHDELGARRRAMIMSWMDQDNEAIERMSAMAADGHRSPSFWLDFSEMVPTRKLKMGLLALGILQHIDNPVPADDEDMAHLRLSLAQLMHAEGNDNCAATELSLCSHVAEPMARYGAIKSVLNPSACPNYNNEIEYHRLAVEALALIYRHIKSQVLTVIKHSDRNITLAGSNDPPILVDSVLWPLLDRVAPGDSIEVKRSGSTVLMARPVTAEPYNSLSAHYAIVLADNMLQCADRPEPMKCDCKLPPEGTAVIGRTYLDSELNCRVANAAAISRAEALRHFKHATVAVTCSGGMMTGGQDGPDFEIADNPALPGELRQVYYYKDRRGRACAIEVLPAPQNAKCDAIKDVSGKLTLNRDGNARVRDVEIPAHLVSEAGVEDNTFVTTRAVYNPATGRWQALKITTYT